MENEFSNGLLGHRVELHKSNEGETVLIVDKVMVFEEQGDRGYAMSYDMYLVQREDGCIVPVIPDAVKRIVGVIRPEPPAKQYADWVTQMAKERELTEDELIVWLKNIKVDRVDIPETPVKPYSKFSKSHRSDILDILRLQKEVLIPAGFGQFSASLADQWLYAAKDDFKILIQASGVSMVDSKGYATGASVPLNEWVKNPTIEALMPPKQD